MGDPRYFLATSIVGGRNLVFPSGRPHTSMSLLRQPWMKVIRRELLQPGGRPQPVWFEGEEHWLIPVTRYAEEAEGGLYYDPYDPTEPPPGGFFFGGVSSDDETEETEDDEEAIGTFYYWEPDSQVYLDMGAKGQFEYHATKLGAAASILQSGRLPPGPIRNRLAKVTQQTAEKALEQFRYWQRSEKPARVEPNPSIDLITDLFQGKENPNVDFDLTYRTEEGKYYGDYFVAVEDPLDQPLAWAMRELGLNVIILGQMADEYNVGTEILDVRPRFESLANLVWTVA